MPSYDASSCDVWIFTFKEGILSRVAHDLKLKLERFSVEISESGVEAKFDTRSLRVECARSDGRDARGVLSARDVSKIEAQIREDVLHSDRFPEARFVSQSVEVAESRLKVRGQIDLHGRRKDVEAQFERRGEVWATELSLYQPDFGIRPFRAAFGALKVQPQIKVRLEVPARVVAAYVG
jgi:hypothetical protein